MSELLFTLSGFHFHLNRDSLLPVCPDPPDRSEVMQGETGGGGGGSRSGPSISLFLCPQACTISCINGDVVLMVVPEELIIGPRWTKVLDRRRGGLCPEAMAM